MKPYQQISIRECGESLMPIPSDIFALETPHPYQKLGAPYHLSKADSPYYLREGVLQQLIIAQNYLQQQYPQRKILIFDAYRPVEVQQFMVDYNFSETAKSQGYSLPVLSEEKKAEILAQVYQFWAVPSYDRATPPPHSTGAALDITLVDQNNQIIEMGSPIDEISARSYPNHFANSCEPREKQYHQNRELLKEIMVKANFQQHPNEWWHFCLGDQMWAWLQNKATNTNQFIARYGRY